MRLEPPQSLYPFATASISSPFPRWQKRLLIIPFPPFALSFACSITHTHTCVASAPCSALYTLPCSLRFYSASASTHAPLPHTHRSFGGLYPTSLASLASCSQWKAEGPQVETYVAQRYIQRPYTVGGRKFDMRLYLLVTSFSPLVGWLHREGFCRFSSGRYENKDMENLAMHLTNVAIQKKDDGYDADQGCKWSVKNLKQYLAAKHGKRRVNQLFYDIQMMMIRTLQSVQKTIIQDRHCFELYGYDVIIDADLKPWLLEVNASPSLTASNDEDYSLKSSLLEDVFNVVDIEEKRLGTEVQIGGFDLVWNNGAVAGAPVTGGDRNRITALASTDAALALHYPRRSQQKSGAGAGGGSDVRVLSQFSARAPPTDLSYLGAYSERTESKARRRQRALRPPP